MAFVFSTTTLGTFLNYDLATYVCLCVGEGFGPVDRWTVKSIHKQSANDRFNSFFFFSQLLCLTVVAVRGSVAGPEARSATPTGTDDKRLQSSGSVGILDSVLRGNGKSRQSRCVRCYEDRYYSSDRYGGGSDRYGASDRYGGASDRYGGYASRAADDPRSSWYYSYDRYDDRAVTGRDRDYDRYYSRDDRYAPRGSTYDRYEGRGAYDDYRRGSAYDRGYGTGYGYASYDSRDRYYADRYSDSSRGKFGEAAG